VKCNHCLVVGIPCLMLNGTGYVPCERSTLCIVIISAPSEGKRLYLQVIKIVSLGFNR